MLTYEHACRATQGARPYQEDMAAFWPGEDAFADQGGNMRGAYLVAVLADGMGGHTGGALASRMVCETFLNAFARQSEPLPQRLVTSLEASNHALAEKVAANPILSGMGSTVIGAAFGPEGLQWVSVGDSPLFLYRRGEIALLNEDHSLAPELDRLAEAGRITFDQARSDPRRHMLRSAVTGEEIELVDVSRKPLVLEPGDYVILASDGVQTLEADEIVRIVDAYGGEGPQAVANALIREVDMMRDEHQDNATVVAIRPVFRDV